MMAVLLIALLIALGPLLVAMWDALGGMREFDLPPSTHIMGWCVVGGILWGMLYLIVALAVDVLA